MAIAASGNGRIVNDDAAQAAALEDPELLLYHRMTAVVEMQRLLADSEAAPDALIDRIPEMALSVVAASGAFFELIDGDVAVLQAGAPDTAARGSIGFRLKLQGSLSGEAVRLNRAVRCDETEGDARVAAGACRKFGIRSLLAAVVRDRSGPIGILKLFDYAPGHFGDADVASLALVADALGLAIQRKRAEAEVQRLLRTQMGLIRLQQDVASSAGGLDSALETIAARSLELTGSDGAAIALIDGEELIFRAAAGVAGPLLMRSVSSTGNLLRVAIASRAIVRCDDTEADDRVDHILCREIGVRSMIIAPLLLDSGSVGGSLSLFSTRTLAFTSVDLGTLQLLAEWVAAVLQRSASAEHLRRSESQYRSLFAAHPLPMWIYDLETLKFLAVNDSAVAEYGYSQSEFLTMTVADIRPESALPLLQDFLAKRGHEPVTTKSWEHLRKNGSTKDVEVTASNTRFGGRAAQLVVVEDVTERNRFEREIQKSDALLKIASSVAKVGGWTLDLGDSAFSWTDELCAICDLPPGTQCSAAKTLDFYVPHSRKTIAAAFDRMRLDGTPFDLELEMVTARDRRLSVRSIGQPIRDAGGHIVGARGAVQDISDRRIAEEKALSLAASLTTTLESITDAFYTLDSQWRFTYVNGETERLLQRSRNDLMGRRIWDLFPELENAEFGRQLRDAAERNAAAVFDLYYEPWRQWFDLHAYPSETGLTVYFRDVTERHQNQQRLLLLETCVASMKDVVLITEIDPVSGSDTRIVFVNEAFVRLTGFSQAEALAGTPKMLQGPKTQRSELDRIRAALDRREAVRAELINYTKAGLEYSLEMEIVPVWSPTGEATHFVAVERDTTHRRAAQEALRSLNETLEAKVTERTGALERSNDALKSKELEISSVVEHMADGVITFDDYGIVRAANPKVESIFGQAPAAILGAHISLLIPQLDSLASKSTADAAQAINLVGPETYGRHLSGEPIPIEIACSDFRIGGQRLWTTIVRDIGERLRTMADLEQAKRVAEEASSAKSAFVATMSHEIRTPMNGVIGMIDVLHQTALAPDQSRMLGIARESAHALLAIIEDILDFSKIEAGRLELERLPMSLVGVVKKASALMLGMAVGKGVELVVQVDSRLPAAVWGDAGRLRQIVVNLVSNAIKFSAGRNAAKVSVRARLGDNSVDHATLELEVEDNGIGMAAATVDRLFQPFSQADVSTTRRFGGTGLGLAISSHLVGLMGGRLDVRSTPGIGSVFIVRMLFVLASSEDVETARPPCNSGPVPLALTIVPPGARQYASRVLVAEDNEINQKVIAAQLNLLGYRAVVVANGREALTLWRGGGFDAVLTDLQMPEMDGYELASTIRAEEGGSSRIPILALTANAVREEAHRCTATGMDDYLTKPVPMHMLDTMLQRWLTIDLADAPPVDLLVLPALIGNDPALIGQFMLDFVASATDAAAEMTHASDPRGVAHRLKSSARAVGAIHLGELCEAIENAPINGDATEASSRIASFDRELERVRRWMDSQGRALPAVSEGTP